MKTIAQMTATVQKQKFRIVQKADGKFDVKTWSTLGKTYEAKGMTFREAGMWVWNMADNHDISHVVNERMCQKFHRAFA